MHFLGVVTAVAGLFLQQEQQWERRGKERDCPGTSWPRDVAHKGGTHRAGDVPTVLVEDVWSSSINIHLLVHLSLDFQLKPSRAPIFPGKMEYFVHIFAPTPPFLRILSE